nr:hypothetical protein [Tanacetum cinerariifolium]
MAAPVIPISSDSSAESVGSHVPRVILFGAIPAIIHVMAAPTILIFVEENLGDPIDIRVDIIHPDPIPAVAFPIAVVEELTAISFRVDIAEAEIASLRAKITTTKAIEKITHNREIQVRNKTEQQLVAVQE